MSGNPPAIIRLYRIVHLRNVEYILSNGMYTRQSPHFDPNYVEIGDSTLISERHDYPVGLAGYGDLGEYVPFYLSGHSPMLLNIKTGYRSITRRPQHEIVYFVCKLDDVIAHCNEWVFTDGHAKNLLTSFFNDLDDLSNVDWDMVREQYWRPTEEDHDRQRRKQAEFLVRNHVPAVCIEEIVVRDAIRKETIEQIAQRLNLSISIKVDIQNKVYYYD